MKEVILIKLRWTASVETLEEYHSEVNLMKEGEVWKSKQSTKFCVWM